MIVWACHISNSAIDDGGSLLIITLGRVRSPFEGAGCLQDDRASAVRGAPDLPDDLQHLRVFGRSLRRGMAVGALACRNCRGEGFGGRAANPRECCQVNELVESFGIGKGGASRNDLRCVHRDFPEMRGAACGEALPHAVPVIDDVDTRRMAGDEENCSPSTLDAPTWIQSP